MAASGAGAGSNPLAEVLFIQFARAPLPGQVKTRMQPDLTPQQSCDLHEALLEWICRRIVSAELGALEIWTSAVADHPVFERCTALGASDLHIQQGRDLGERMHHALTDGLRRARKVILVGSDCPSIDAAYLQQAVLVLDECGCVLGPALDGGYVLIGVRGRVPECFAGVSWGTDRVYRQTAERLASEGVSWQALGSLRDIDRPDDLPEWRALQDIGAVPMP